jgi:putative tryptophan/tyrosine transport system substrate-binding protein
MRRREFITLLGGTAAVWPIAAWAQQPVMPVIGYLDITSPDTRPPEFLRAFRQGLKETGYVEGENVAIEYRWGPIDQVGALTAELVQQQVAVIIPMGGNEPPLAAKARTTTIPIVFVVGDDPVRLGLVASLAHPGGNLTGVNFFTNELTAKRLELLRTLVPGAARVAVLVNPASSSATDLVRDAQSAARSIGLQIQVLNASTSTDIDTAFAALVRERVDALFVGSGPFFTARRFQLAHLATRHAVPAIYTVRQFTEVGGLMSYGANLADAYRQAGIYAGRILKGAKPSDLPVVQSTKFELVINAQIARTLGLIVPPTLLALADEVIE